MEKFMASNGGEVEVFEHGRMSVSDNSREQLNEHSVRIGRTAYLDPEMISTLREFFLHERDQELGRWRWPENPDYVVYPVIDPAHEMAFGRDLSVMVFHEPTGVLKGYCRDEDQGGNSREYPNAARAYFAAHPEPKPWHDAKPGEVWVLTYRSPSARETSNNVMTCVDDGGNISFFNDYRLHTVRYTGIESARRIWPEESSNG